MSKKGGKDFRRMAQRIRRLPTLIETHVDAEIGMVMRAMAQSARQFIVQQRAIATGNLAANTRHHNVRTSSVSVPFSTGYATHIVRADAPHAPYIEYGTGVMQRGSPRHGERFKSPSVAPTQSIFNWIQTKGITARNPEYEDSDYALAEAIAESIQRFGTRPQPFMRPAWHQHEQQLYRAHDRGVRKALRQM